MGFALPPWLTAKTNPKCVSRRKPRKRLFYAIEAVCAARTEGAPKMRLCVFIAALLVAISTVGSLNAATIVSYPVDNLRLDVVEKGGIFADKSGNIWFAARYLPGTVSTRPALCRIDPIRNKLYRYILPTMIDEVGALAYDQPRNTIWIADSAGTKLCKFQIVSSRLTVYNLPIALGDMADCQSIALDGAGTVYCALFTTDAVAVFNPATPRTLTGYPILNDVIEHINPYSVAYVEYGSSTVKEVLFTSGPNTFAGYLLGSLVPATRDIKSYAAGTAEADTWCISASTGTAITAYSETAGTAESVYAYVTADALGAVGRFDYVPTVGFGTLDLCTTNIGAYGIDLPPDDAFLGITEPGVSDTTAPTTPGQVVWLATEQDFATGTVTTKSDTILVGEVWTRAVRGPWVYQIRPSVLTLRPNTWTMDPDQVCDADEVEEYIISDMSMPGAVVAKTTATLVSGVPTNYADIWVADFFDDKIVKLMREYPE